MYGVSATVELLSLSSSSHFKRVLALPFTQSFTPEPTLKECLSINLFDGTEQLLMLCYPLTCTDPFTARDALRRLQLDCASVSSSSFHVIMHTVMKFQPLSSSSLSFYSNFKIGIRIDDFECRCDGVYSALHFNRLPRRCKS